jgi:hypothetical protein
VPSSAPAPQAATAPTTRSRQPIDTQDPYAQ